MKELFRRYPEETPPAERKGSPACVVSHPDAGGQCPRPAVGEVWGVPFCEVHGTEAELAAASEIEEFARREIGILAEAELERSTVRSPVLALLESIEPPYQTRTEFTEQEEAMLEAYPPEAHKDNTDPDTLSFDYGDAYREGEAGDGPVDWWSDARYLLCRFMREAENRGVLVRELEYLRERATVQMLLAERDYEVRYAAPRREAKAKAKEGGADV
jgi:hypothetical protein